MDRKKLEKDIQEIELKLAEMKKELSKKEEKPFPQIGDTYYFIDQWGVLNFPVAQDNNGRFQIFRTKDEAINFYNVECARQRVKDEIKRLNDGWTPDWTNNSQNKYYIFLDVNILKVDSVRLAKLIDNSMYLASPDLVHKILKSHKDDLFLILGQ